jgi:hypothetical protein
MRVEWLESLIRVRNNNIQHHIDRKEREEEAKPTEKNGPEYLAQSRLATVDGSKNGMKKRSESNNS